MISEARKEGLDIMIDAFPYTCSNTAIGAILPFWIIKGMPGILNKPWALMRLHAQIFLFFKSIGYSYKDLQLMKAVDNGLSEFNGLTIVEMASKWKMSPFRAMIKLIKSSGGTDLMLYHANSGEPGNEETLETVLSNDFCLFGTDVILRKNGYPNPEEKGTFPKILGHYDNNRNLFSMEEAINRMTLSSAEHFRLKDRGLIAKGKAADIVIFDPQAVSDNPVNNDKSTDKPNGIRHVFVNGSHVVKDGSYTNGKSAGQVLR